ncbi:hypothetical protein NQ317_000929 [Molorchus minor]|uniref:Mitochondrial import inner membrane translocase subunit n=1 Tax=Molorchus minor TaxID=1323400 RepID=A0ABQ9K0L6_9CUCU|nr:hypothetical protein NQ317_000929 [Molorchus minor]
MEIDNSALRNFKDFLQLYNKMTEICFNRCIDNVYSRNLDPNEADCVEDCSSKFIKYNNRLMQNFVKAQSEIVNKRVEEAEKQQQLQLTSQKSELEDNKPSTEQNQLEYAVFQDREHVNSKVILSK